MRVELSNNAKEIVTLLTHEDVWEGITNDDCREKNIDSITSGVDSLLPTSLYFKVLDKNSIVGMVSFHDNEEDPVLDIHCAFIKGFRGRFALSAIKNSINLVFKYTEYDTIKAKFSTKQYSVLRFASYLGFKLEHLEEKNYPDQGIMYDTICMTLTKKDYKYA